MLPGDRRRQHLSRHRGRGGRDGARLGRQHGHAGDGDKLAGDAKRARTPRRLDPGAVGDLDAVGMRALYPPPCDPLSRKGPGRDLRRRHRQPVLHHRYGGGAARVGDGLRRSLEGHQGRRRLRRRPPARRDGQAVRAFGVPRSAVARSPGHGRIGDLAGARKPHSDPGVLDLREWRLRPGRPGAGPVYDHHRRTIVSARQGRTVRETAMAEEALLKDVERRMDGAIEALRKEFGGLRTGRASASLLEPIQVNAYGNMTPLPQLASINVPESRMITVQVWDRGNVKAVDKAIRESSLGLNPQTEGQLIRVPIPDLNEERRRELTKVAAKYAEAARVSVRHVRRDGIAALRKKETDGALSQDAQRKLEKEIQTLTDGHIKRIDETLSQKDKEILQV